MVASNKLPVIAGFAWLFLETSKEHESGQCLAGLRSISLLLSNLRWKSLHYQYDDTPFLTFVSPVRLISSPVSMYDFCLTKSLVSVGRVRYDGVDITYSQARRMVAQESSTRRGGILASVDLMMDVYLN